MKKRLLCAVAVAGLVVSACISRIPVHAENKEERELIIYELGDPRVPVTDRSNSVVHNLNASEDEGEDYEGMDERPIIIYELGDPRVPVVDKDNADNIHILEETVAKGDFAPTEYYNLASGAYEYNFSNVTKFVHTNRYFSTNGNGYISVSTTGINNPVRISMIEHGTNEVISSWEGDPRTVLGVGFPGNPSKFYYFRFMPYGVTSVSGFGEIFWDN